MSNYYMLKTINLPKQVNVSSAQDLENINTSYVSLSGCIDFCISAKEDFKKIKGKQIDYHAILEDYIKIEGYKNVFECLDDIKGDITFNSLEFKLSKKVSKNNFQKIVDYINSNKHYYYIDFNISNVNIFSIEQLEILKKLKKEKKNVQIYLNVNQSYGCQFEENNYNDNRYDFDELIEIKKKINEIISLIPKNSTDIEKALFIYRYLGSIVLYDYDMAKENHFGRIVSDRTSLYDVLINNKGVCSGIAMTLKEIMLAAGLKCKSVGSFDHQWNVIEIDGKWYHMDLTWDLNNIKSGKRLQYFLKSEKNISKDESHICNTIYADKDKIATRSLVYTNSKK